MRRGTLSRSISAPMTVRLRQSVVVSRSRKNSRTNPTGRRARLSRRRRRPSARTEPLVVPPLVPAASTASEPRMLLPSVERRQRTEANLFTATARSGSPAHGWRGGRRLSSGRPRPKLHCRSAAATARMATPNGIAKSQGAGERRIRRRCPLPKPRQAGPTAAVQAPRPLITPRRRDILGGRAATMPREDGDPAPRDPAPLSTDCGASMATSPPSRRVRTARRGYAEAVSARGRRTGCAPARGRTGAPWARVPLTPRDSGGQIDPGA